MVVGSGGEDILVAILVLVLPPLAMILIGLRKEKLRPLMVGLALAYLSFPIYYMLSRLPVDYLLRIMLQVLAFIAIVIIVLLSVSLQLRGYGGNR